MEQRDCSATLRAPAGQLAPALTLHWMATPLDAEEFDRWQEQAGSALATADLARAGGRHDCACFLDEQAAQLAVKGLLHAIDEQAWGHDLTVLVAHAAGILGQLWPPTIPDPAARLARHYIPARYPDAHASGAPTNHYTGADADQADADARLIIAAVVGAWQGLSSS